MMSLYQNSKVQQYTKSGYGKTTSQHLNTVDSRCCDVVLCVGKMRLFTRINIRILHVRTSADPHIHIIPPAIPGIYNAIYEKQWPDSGTTIGLT